MNESLSAKIKATGDLIHELDDFTDYENISESADLGLKDDEVVAVAVELLELFLSASFDENSGVTESDIEKIKADKIKIKDSLTATIGDADKTAAFIKSTLNKIRDNTE